jgi:hypothetical protein
LPETHVCPGEHASPQAPQFAFDVFRSAQTPAQSVVPGLHAQLLFMHTSAPAQICPQNPQLFLLLVRSTHELPHRASPEPQAAEHVPALHACPPMHRLPQAPQLVALDCRSTQTFARPPGPPPIPMHSVSPAAHMQEPPMHGAPTGHALPQLPQFVFDVWRSTQVIPPPPIPPPMQAVRPVEQPITHDPAEHIVPPGQRLPQPPQLRGSVCVFVHCTPQSVSPPPHAHAPLAQFAPVGQVFPHMPQFDGSVCSFTQALLQSESPAAHVVVHVPCEQTCPVAQAMPQAPQFFGSPCVSVQTPLQRVPLL